MSSLKDQVIDCLSVCDKCRQDDVHLTLHIWTRHFRSKVHLNYGAPMVYLKDIHTLPREDNVKRIRAKIQNEEGQYLPKDPEVRRRRKITEASWRKYLGYNQSNEYSLSGTAWGE